MNNTLHFSSRLNIYLALVEVWETKIPISKKKSVIHTMHFRIKAIQLDVVHLFKCTPLFLGENTVLLKHFPVHTFENKKLLAHAPVK